MTVPFDDLTTLRDALRHPYDRKQWTHTLLPGLFSSLEIGAKPTPLEVPSKEWEKSFDSAVWLGSARLVDAEGRERRVWFAELVLRDVDRLRARVTLRRGLSKLLGAGEVEAVLAFFKGADGGDYRATYAAAEWAFEEGRVIKKETPPKRFSFALGPKEPGKTAAQRFRWLAERRDARSFSDVAEAFSVEKLNKAFFQGYKERFAALAQALARPATAKAFGVPGTDNPIAVLRDPAYKSIRDFAKRMMGRIVFLRFVQRKGWLGADPGTPEGVYENGDTEYIRKIVEARPGENPYSGPLTTLFFAALNTDRSAAGDACPLTGRKVPYLNSGLFEPEPLNPRARKDPLAQHKELAVPAGPLLDFLAFLDEFNFTVDENSPDESEIGVDPEMLGHIFENLLEDNKEKGAFYTPKAVVSHMCRESLLLHLQRLFGERPELERLVKLHDVGDWSDDRNWVKKHAAEIYEALEKIRVCDPACGSGAFPMGMLNEIFWLRYSLRPVKESELPELRKSIIRNNLHGVDIDGNAVEIARLRFWLSIVVDATRPEPLPNLDFRFLQGDSLVGFVGAEGDWAKRFLLGAEAQEEGGQFALLLGDKQANYRVEKFAKERKRIADLLEAHFKTAGTDKQDLASEILAAERAFVIDVLRHARSDLSKLKGKKIDARVAALDARIKRLRAAEPGEDRDYFPWFFYEDGGFDVVIANPPYISAIDHKKIYGEEARAAIKEAYITAGGAFDLYVCFFELAANLLVEHGVMTFITPNKWLSVSYGEKLRAFMAESMDLRAIVDLSSVDVFKAVSVYPVVSVLRKGTKGRKGYVSVSRGADAEEGNVRLTELPSASEDLLGALPGRIWGFLLDERRRLLTRLLEKSVWLAEKAQVNALTTAAEADELGSLLAEDEHTEMRVTNTGTIDPYISLWGEKALLKQGRKFLHAAFEGSNEALETRRTLFSSPKIIVAKMALRCEAFLDEEGLYAGIDVNTIYAPSKGYTLRFLLGYLHSDCAAFCHRLFFKGLAMSGGYLPFQAPHLRVTPIPDLNAPGGEELKEHVEMVVGRILKKGLPSPEDRAEIDAAVAKFHGLTAGDLSDIAAALGEDPGEADGDSDSAP
ncbi:hypothetical protein CBM2637_A30017 [Cupriavidus taiwanensis]|uniref:Eco57I restriction-modification methylase domain-containing protein n=1 Tax=Cupriavidus taiwanensis TaxID=164546 RepID=UPI000E140300|nr:Eco57I restriction-modification methylase domain-containing protein [Cupriavidus taiwanensis]SPA28031.1 hypothetical protein CBM2637_A30017 [Cupriavidus taiwanensis]